MIRFTTQLERFGQQGEKTGWTYLAISEELAAQLKPGCRSSYRVKGRIDKMPIKSVALVPMGAGDFILAVNAAMRKLLRKEKGASVEVVLEVDDDVFETPADIAECLADEPEATAFYESLPLSHRRYFARWVESAKTDATRAKRIAQMLDAMARGMGYGEMIRAAKARKEKDGF
ncbi:YdeI/OmpD-associated family protein [Flaviaesturariibacter terrae]